MLYKAYAIAGALITTNVASKKHILWTPYINTKNSYEQNKATLQNSINIIMIKPETLKWWKRDNIHFYLSKPMYKKHYSNTYKAKLNALGKSTKTRYKSKGNTKVDDFSLSKSYKLHRVDNNKAVATVTLKDVKRMTNLGITVLAEKDGFKC